MKLEALLARRYLSSQKGRGLSAITWIALLGVIVGVMSLVTVLAVMSGFDRDLRAKILGNNAHIRVQMNRYLEVEQKEFDKALETIRKIEGVHSAMPVIYGEGFILSPFGGTEGVILKGVDSNLVQEVLDLDEYVQNKNWSEFKDGRIILGDTLASTLNLHVGDPLTLVLNRGDFSPLGMMPRMKKLVVSDVFHSRMTQYDGRHGYLQIDTASRLFETEPSFIEVRTTDATKINDVRNRIRAALPDSFRVHDWISMNKDFLSALQLEKTVMAVILAFILLVASFNICGSLIMLVKDKTRDIAILKSMGALDKTVLKIFFMQGIFIGLSGTVIGIILGLVLSVLLRDYVQFPLSAEVYMIDTLPVDIRGSDIALVAVGAFIISSLATLYPARLAAKIIPTEGLKAD